jgi:hypothetical protein
MCLFSLEDPRSSKADSLSLLLLINLSASVLHISTWDLVETEEPIINSSRRENKLVTKKLVIFMHFPHPYLPLASNLQIINGPFYDLTLALVSSVRFAILRGKPALSEKNITEPINKAQTGHLIIHINP